MKVNSKEIQNFSQSQGCNSSRVSPAEIIKVSPKYALAPSQTTTASLTPRSFELDALNYSR